MSADARAAAGAAGPHRRWRREDFPPTPARPGDETGWEAYHRQMFGLADGDDPFAGRAGPPSDWVRWKIFSTGVNVARRLAVARSRGRLAWVGEHGDDVEQWPLAHPPAVLWVPYSSSAACLRCWWLGHVADEDAEVVARTHSGEHAAGDGLRPDTASGLRTRPVPVWGAEGPVAREQESSRGPGLSR